MFSVVAYLVEFVGVAILCFCFVTLGVFGVGGCGSGICRCSVVGGIGFLLIVCQDSNNIILCLSYAGFLNDELICTTRCFFYAASQVIV